MSKLSRRSLVTAAGAQDERKLVMLADEIERAWNDVGNEADESAGADVLWRRIEEATDAMDEICARSIPGLIAKARVADLRLRVNGEPHSEGRYAWSVIDDLLALGSAA
jgi:ribosome biogenesis protein Tsr3